MLWGEKDLNVDAKSEYQFWRETFSAGPQLTVRLLANANHGLLDAQAFGGQHFGVGRWLKMLWRDWRALSPEFLPVVIGWLNILTDRLDSDK